MLGNRRLREGQLIDNLTAHSSLFQRQHTKDANPSWMPDRLRQLCQFLIGFRALKALKVGVGPRFDRRAADGIGFRVIGHSHSTINDIMTPASRQAPKGRRRLMVEPAAGRFLFDTSAEGWLARNATRAVVRWLYAYLGLHQVSVSAVTVTERIRAAAFHRLAESWQETVGSLAVRRSHRRDSTGGSASCWTHRHRRIAAPPDGDAPRTPFRRQARIMPGILSK